MKQQNLNKLLNLRKFLIDGAAIFFSILASFSVENYREDLEKKSIWPFEFLNILPTGIPDLNNPANPDV